MPNSPVGRRPLKARALRLPRALASWLARRHVRPDWISVSSVLFAAAAALALLATRGAPGGTPALWLLAAAGIQLRLVANLLDGLVAVEGGLGGPLGELFNEAPDRLSDSLILVAAGYATTATPALGWCAALMAMACAYVRVLAACLGLPGLYLGPGAKQHRMFVVTTGCLVAAAGAWAHPGARSPAWMAAALGAVLLLSAWSLVRRLRRLAVHLRRGTS